jgi:hypothetical protein
MIVAAVFDDELPGIGEVELRSHHGLEDDRAAKKTSADARTSAKRQITQVALPLSKHYA